MSDYFIHTQRVSSYPKEFKSNIATLHVLKLRLISSCVSPFAKKKEEICIIVPLHSMLYFNIAPNQNTLR